MLQGVPSTASQRADFALAKKLAAARDLSGALSTSAIFTLPPQDILLQQSLKERARGNARQFAVLGAAVSVAGFAGLLVTLAFNSWRVEDVGENPWLGASRKALLDAGSICTTCIIDGEWWRLLSAIFIPAGIAQALFNSLLFFMAAVLTSRTGMLVVSFAVCSFAGAVGGSLASAVGASKTVHSSSSALPAAATATALVAILTVRRFLQGWRMPSFLLFLWFGLLVVASLAPFADTFATVGGFVVGTICASSVLAPHITKVCKPYVIDVL
jgi:membrane associated rhomboid family serine protease